MKKTFLIILLAFITTNFSVAQGIYGNTASQNDCKNPTVKKGETVTYYLYTFSGGYYSGVFEVKYTATSLEYFPTGKIRSVGEKLSSEFIAYCKTNGETNRTHSTQWFAKRKLKCIDKHIGNLKLELKSGFSFQHKGYAIRKIN